MANDKVTVWGGTTKFGRTPLIGEVLVGNDSGFTLSGGAEDNTLLTPPTASSNMEITTVGGQQVYGFAGYCGSFYDTTIQTNALATNLMTFNTTAISYGVSIVSNSRITFAHTGVYNLQFSAQMIDTSNNESVYIWLKKNGSNYDTTNTEVYLPLKNKGYVAAWNFLIDVAAGDYFELAWASASSAMTIAYNATPPYGPGVPSVILTANLVR